jgi:hypothetical protein
MTLGVPFEEWYQILAAFTLTMELVEVKAFVAGLGVKRV